MRHRKSKISISLILFLFLIFFWVWKDYKKIDTSYVNQSGVTYAYKNLNSNFLKKIHKKTDKFIQEILVTYFSSHRNYWKPEDNATRASLPEIIKIKSKNNFTLTNNDEKLITDNWYKSHGNDKSVRFSNLDLINNKNVSQLKLAWTFTSDGFKGDIQANPIVVNGIIYTPISGGFIAAIDGATGNLIWKSKKFGNSVAKRGLTYWVGNKKKNQNPKLFFSNRERLVALDPKNGNLLSSFGRDGEVRTGLNVFPPIIYKDKIILATWDRAFEIYDLHTGKVDWKLKYYKKNNSRIGGKLYNNSGANPWGGISADLERGIVYTVTGNPHSYFDGTLRPGDNTYSSSVIALSIEQKKILWHFQETSHDIWNHDIPSPPILTKIKKDSKNIDVVVVPTKRANTLILDRVTGEPIYDFIKRKAPISTVPGEKTSPYQPDFLLPEPFGRNVFKLNDIWSFDKDEELRLKKKYSNYTYGFYEPNHIGKKGLQYNFHGGAEWPGGSVDTEKGILYVTSNNMLVETELVNLNKNQLIPKYKSKYNLAVDKYGYPAIKPPWGTLTALNLNNGKIIWQVPFGEYEELTEKGIPKTGTENIGGATATNGDIIIATGTLDKKLYIFDSNNGKVIFSMKLPFIGSAPPTTYIANNEQYIIVHSTGGQVLKDTYPDLVEIGNTLIALKLN
jgi:quinoprotein glucose dehydrogenase